MAMQYNISPTPTIEATIHPDEAIRGLIMALQCSVLTFLRSNADPRLGVFRTHLDLPQSFRVCTPSCPTSDSAPCDSLQSINMSMAVTGVKF